MIDAKTFAKYARDPAAFRADLLVDVDGVARRFGDVMDDWQRADFKALDPPLRRCVGRSKSKTAKMRAYLERPRGHSKTHDLAVMCVWALAFSTRPLKAYCFAADKDQAKLLRDAMETIVRLNPWLATILDVQRTIVWNIATGHPGAQGKLEIYPSDVASSWGILPDLIIADELVHWIGDGSLWHSILSSAAKRSNCLLCTITNAGFADSWQWSVREAAHTDPAWLFSRQDGPVASWITEDRLAEQRRMLPPVAYLRLWENQWSSGGGDALLPSDIAAAFRSELEPMSGHEKNYYFVGGVDLSLTRDFTAVVVLAAERNAGRIRLAHHRLWRPLPNQKINLLDVERHVLEMDKQFGLEFCVFDPWQAESMMMRCEVDRNRKRRNSRRIHKNKAWARELPPTAQNLRAQATLMIESFTDRRLRLFECEPLRQDLLHLRAEEKSYGIRLTSPRTAETGHGDSSSAFSLALLVAHELGGKSHNKIRAYSGGPFDPVDSKTAMDLALERLDNENAAREEDQRMFAQPDPFEGFDQAVIRTYEL